MRAKVPMSLMEEELARRLELFVGREAERAHWRALLATGSAARVLHVHGDAGFGKSSLLHVFAADAARAGASVVAVDARDVEASAAGVRALLRSIDDAPAPRRGLRAIIVDSLELLRPHEDAFVRELLHRATNRHRIAVASRGAPSSAWTTLALWGTTVVGLPLSPLSQPEAEDYVARRHVHASRRREVTRFARGVPLALALAVEAIREAPRDGGALAGPRTIRALCERFLGTLDDTDRRVAVEICAIVRVLTEDVLAALAPALDAHAAFAWLVQLSFVESTAHGIAPHELAREAIIAELSWRNPARYRDLIGRAIKHFGDVLSKSDAADAWRMLLDFGYMMRRVPRVGDMLAVPSGVSLSVEPAGDDDFGAIASIVERHEGEAALPALRHWWSRQPEGFTVIRDVERRVAAFVAILRLDRATAEDLAADVATRGAWGWATRVGNGPPRGEVPFVRFLADAVHYQAPCPSIAACAALVGQPLVLSRALTFYFHVYASWETWRPIAELAGAKLVPEAGFECGGRHYAVSAHDRRGVTPGTWAAWMAERALSAVAEEQDGPQPPDSSSVDFERAVRAGLRHLHDPVRLGRTPLAGIFTPPPGTQKGSHLRRLLLEEIDALRGVSRGDRLYRAMKLAYVTPAESQEHAAESIGVGYSTFRRHLEAAIARVASGLRSRHGSAG